MIWNIKNNNLSVDISNLGAEMQSIKKDNVEYLWQGDKKSWKNKATNIFPIIGKLQNGKYFYKDKEYELGSHGLARYMEFEANKLAENKISFKIISNSDTLKSYPFKFEYYIIYELIENSLNITSKVINIDDKTMYFALGGHPGFCLSRGEELTIEDYYLEFDFSSKVDNYLISNKGLVTGKEEYSLEEDKILRLKASIFDNDALIFNGMAKGVKLKSDKTKREVYIKYPNMEYLGIWQTPELSPDFLCIEPWTSLPARDGIIEDIEKQGLVSLEPSKEYINTWSISIK